MAQLNQKGGDNLLGPRLTRAEGSARGGREHEEVLEGGRGPAAPFLGEAADVGHGANDSLDSAELNSNIGEGLWGSRVLLGSSGIALGSGGGGSGGDSTAIVKNVKRIIGQKAHIGDGAAAVLLDLDIVDILLHHFRDEDAEALRVLRDGEGVGGLLIDLSHQIGRLGGQRSVFGVVGEDLHDSGDELLAGRGIVGGQRLGGGRRKEGSGLGGGNKELSGSAEHY